MRNVLLIGICLLGICCADKIPFTRLRDPLAREMLTPEKFEAEYAMPNDTFVLGAFRTPKTYGPLVDIVLDARLLTPLEAEISTFARDLEDAGFAVRIDTMRSGNADNLKLHLEAITDLVGSVFIGNLPVKWFRMIESFDEGDTTIEIFPCDYYYTDLNGIWYDVDDDGVLDSHDIDENPQPEIWLGRIDASRLSYGEEVVLLKKYFAKNHAFRVGDMPIFPSALSYEYSDWHDFFSYRYRDFLEADIMRDVSLFSASDYLRRIRNNMYEFVNVLCHSSPWRHYMSGTLMFATDIAIVPANALFYNLFACSGARFVERDNLANTYLFMGDNSLWVTGSTKTGSFITTPTLIDFIDNLRSMSGGVAFQSVMSTDAEIFPDWHYGMVFLGDPTLSLIYEERGILVDTLDIAHDIDGNVMFTATSIADIGFLFDNTGAATLLALTGSEEWYNICRFSYTGTDFINNGYSDMYLSFNGLLTSTKSMERPLFVTEGSEISILSLTSWSELSNVKRGEGYHSYPFFIGTTDHLAIGYVYWNSVRCGLYLSPETVLGFSSDADIIVTESETEICSPCGVLDSLGNYILFWQERITGNNIICAKSTLSCVPDELHFGKAPAAIVNSAGEVVLFFTDESGAVCCGTYSPSTTFRSRTIFSCSFATNLYPLLDAYGRAWVLVSAKNSFANPFDLYAISAEEGCICRLTWNDGNDVAAKGFFDDENQLVFAWLSNSEILCWNRIDLTEIKEHSNMIPYTLGALQARPSPFNSAVEIIAGTAGELQVQIVDIAGKIVCELTGKKQITWKPETERSGVYFARASGFKTCKLLYMK